MLIFEKIPGGKSGKRFLKGRTKYGAGYLHYQVFRRDVVGSLRVDQSDPDSGPYLFLELSHKGADAIYKKRYVVLKVNIKNYISHE